MDVSFADVVGTVGVLLIVFVYLLLQSEKLDPKGLFYSLSNAIGSVMILYSLLEHWNLASVVIEVFWILISLFGVWRYFRRQKSS
jgi:hypothetical protein